MVLETWCLGLNERYIILYLIYYMNNLCTFCIWLHTIISIGEVQLRKLVALYLTWQLKLLMKHSVKPGVHC